MGSDTSSADLIAEAVDRLSMLEDLFRRRLLDDRDKRQAFNALYARLEAAEKALAGELFLPLVRPLLLMIDRLDSYEVDDDFVSSIRAELLEALIQNGVEEIEVSRDFDAAVCEVIEVREAEGSDGEVVGVRRRGFRLGTRVVRPAQVVVSGTRKVALPRDAEQG